MFTIEQINEAAGKVNNGADFPRFVSDLEFVGVTHYEYFVANGKLIYSGQDGFQLAVDSNMTHLDVNEIASKKKLKQAIIIHQRGETDYPTFCQDAAQAGVEKWITHMHKMTVAYLDKRGNEILVELIPYP